MKQVNYKIVANAQNITAKIRDRLIRLTLNDGAGIENDSAEIELDNRDDAIEPPPTGAQWDISIGYGDDEQLIFKGTYTVDEISEPLDIDTLTISAQSSKMKQSFKAPRDHSYDNVTLGSLADEIAQRHGYEASIENSLAGIAFVHLDQRGESDSNLLTRLARENSAMFKLAANKLLMVPKQQGKTARGKTLPVIEITDRAHSSGSVTTTDREDYNSVAAHWFDELKQQKVQELAGTGSPQFVIRKTHADQVTASRAAGAKLAELQRGKAQLSITRPLNPLIVAEGFLQVSNHKKAANGRWLVESVTHTIEGSAFAQTAVKCVVPQ